MSRYKQLADKCIADIQAGRLKPGTRMPSLRQFARQQQISVSTAVSCYQELTALGWVCARPQSGFYITAVDASHPLPEWRPFASRISTPARTQTTVERGPLGVSHSPLSEQAIQDLDVSFRRALKRIGSRLSRYPDYQGEVPLRQSLATHLTGQGFPVLADELVITHGCLSAVKTALETCTQPGDAVAVNSPCFNGLLELLAQMSLNIVEIPTLEDGLDLAQLEHHLKAGTIQAGLFSTSFMNPQGITLSVAQKQQLAELARRYQTPIIEDDVYLELSHQGDFVLPAKYYDTDGYLLWCGSVSKTLSPSYRLGWCLPGRFKDAYLAKFAAGSYGVATQIQLAIADFIDTGHYAQFLRKKRMQLLGQKQTYLDYLRQHLPAQTRISVPQGGLVLWLQFPGLNSEGLAQAIEEAQIDIRLGPLFTSLGHYQDCLRINIGYPLDEMVKPELDKLITLLNRYTETGHH
ncbi:PLP-dependent aminotransferase family protein [Photobacterium atrarenae]|uniref:PLP-dependent aminotransferase family protein n=1 Tax=Photobacterium atrarenae TaxID=865757 RepID=A0ABY5GKC5_9GAMM|nr:PLP-dependent aminotransferase family protein [Photobacterium atrarenae]UTV29564.1 PLP-dependent aminotransferase family protein [Photobacterium atrarenae]